MSPGQGRIRLLWIVGSLAARAHTQKYTHEARTAGMGHGTDDSANIDRYPCLPRVEESSHVSMRICLHVSDTGARRGWDELSLSVSNNRAYLPLQGSRALKRCCTPIQTDTRALKSEEQVPSQPSQCWLRSQLANTKTR